jgi:cardiolipin synthase
MSIYPPRMLLALCSLFSAAGCAALPDAEVLLARSPEQAARFENASGPLSAQKNTAVLAALKRSAGDIDILDRHLAVEQALVGSPLVLGNKVTLLQDGPATYAAMFAAMRAARDHIHLESYIIEEDAIGQQFAELLLAKQRQGVQVNVIYDSFGAINTSKAFFTQLSDGGIQVLEFNPLNPLNSRSDDARWQLNNRDHRKLLIVDGHTAFIGGINISSVYSSGSGVHRKAKKTDAGAANAIAWRDTDLQIEGPVVAELQKLFIATWEKQHGPPRRAQNDFPALKARGQDIVRAIGSSPAQTNSPIYLTLISAIRHAERNIRLTQAYFVPDPQLLQALEDAAARGVEVQLILPGHSDSALVFHAGRSNYSRLLKAGIQIYERRGALLHAKTALIDGVWSWVGSSNLDWRSFLDNDEVNAVVLGADFAQQMQTMFTGDIAASEAIDPARWEERPLLLRIREWASRLWQRLL